MIRVVQLSGVVLVFQVALVFPMVLVVRVFQMGRTVLGGPRDPGGLGVPIRKGDLGGHWSGWLGVIRVVGVVRVVQGVQMFHVVRVVRMISLDDMHSENIWFS